MSYQVHGTCYATTAQALSATASDQQGAFVTFGGSSYIAQVSSVTDAAITYEYSPVGGGPTVAQTVQLTPQPCGLLTAQDGLELGWMVAAVWLAAFGLTFIGRYIQAEIFGQKDDS